MGQAKDRGTREERIAMAIAKKRPIGKNSVGVIGTGVSGLSGYAGKSLLMGMAIAAGAGLDNSTFYGEPKAKNIPNDGIPTIKTMSVIKDDE